jgi:hypothetical protein
LTIPVGIDPHLAAHLEELERRLAIIEGPLSPRPAFPCTKAGLPPAAAHIYCVVFITDLNILAHSDGSNWRREDTGAVA